MSVLTPEHAFATIVVTEHAEQRARERFRVDLGIVERDVRDALLFDRACDHSPSWLSGRDHGEPVVWTRDRERIYIVAVTPRSVIVKTAVSHCRPGC